MTTGKIYHDEGRNIKAEHVYMQDKCFDDVYLLQALEGYNGIVFVGCKLRNNIDEAFIRRLNYVVDLQGGIQKS